MQIHLKQVEIVAAIKKYISSQVIDLSGKGVSIIFTAGRKESGISADLVIEDADIPGFTEADPAPMVGVTAPVLAMVNKPVAIAGNAADEEKPPMAEAEVVVPAAKTTSLFN